MRHTRQLQASIPSCCPHHSPSFLGYEGLRHRDGTCPETDRFQVEDCASWGLVRLPLGRELPRGMVPQRAVRPVLIVVSLPLQNLVLCVSDREEQLDVEMLIPQTSIEALDEGIVHGLPRAAP